MIRSDQLRIPLLAATFAGVLFVLGKSMFAPSASNRGVSAFVFPPQMPLQQWQPLPSRPIAPQEAPIGQERSPSGRHYQYIQNGLPLDIEMRYIVDTDGDIKRYVRSFTSMKPSGKFVSTVHQRQEVGFYSLFVKERKAYLSACINPRGGTTVTNVQFMQNRKTYDLQLNRLLPWLLGQEVLTDTRCLWALLSVPVKEASPEKAYTTLETAWFSVYPWWQPRFPKP
jgi:cyanosortase A-associated protein